MMSCSKNTIFGSDYCYNNGCGQYALIGVRLLFEGGHYNFQGLAAGGYYSRAATIQGRLYQGRRLIEEIRYPLNAFADMLASIHELCGWSYLNNGTHFYYAFNVYIITTQLDQMAYSQVI